MLSSSITGFGIPFFVYSILFVGWLKYFWFLTYSHALVPSKGVSISVSINVGTTNKPNSFVSFSDKSSIFTILKYFTTDGFTVLKI